MSDEQIEDQRFVEIPKRGELLEDTRVQVGSAPVQGVYVVNCSQLPKLLHQLG